MNKISFLHCGDHSDRIHAETEALASAGFSVRVTVLLGKSRLSSFFFQPSAPWPGFSGRTRQLSTAQELTLP
ncbi:MAG: hypothetical protein PHW04_17855 [Candidatus Wallbacteria bacterium]|nr:hypothetical protein [Candidatus Wallbacteria bacterium]